MQRARAQGLAEYAFLLVLIGVVCVAVVATLGQTVLSDLSGIASRMP